MLFVAWLLTFLPGNRSASLEVSRGPTVVISCLSMRDKGQEAPAGLVAWEAIWAGTLVGSPRVPAVGKEGPDFQPGMISSPSLLFGGHCLCTALSWEAKASLG